MQEEVQVQQESHSEDSVEATISSRMKEPETSSRISLVVKTHSQGSLAMILMKITSLEAALDEVWEAAWAVQLQAIERRSNNKTIPSVTLVVASEEVSEVAWVVALEGASETSEDLEVASVVSEASRATMMTSSEVDLVEASTHSRAASHQEAQDPHQ